MVLVVKMMPIITFDYPTVGKIEPSQKLLFIVFHGGTLLDVGTDTTKMADCQLLQQSLSNVVNTICPTYKNRYV